MYVKLSNSCLLHIVHKISSNEKLLQYLLNDYISIISIVTIVTFCNFFEMYNLISTFIISTSMVLVISRIFFTRVIISFSHKSHSIFHDTQVDSCFTTPISSLTTYHSVDSIHLTPFHVLHS